MKNQHKTVQQAETYTSPALERFMARENAERRRKVGQLMELGGLIYEGIKAKYGDKHGALKAFAEEMGRSQSEVSKWVSGRHNFTAELLFAIQDHLGISLIATGAPPKEKEVVKFVPVIVSAASPAPQIAVPQETVEDWQQSQSFTLQGNYVVRMCKDNQVTETLAGSIYG